MRRSLLFCFLLSALSLCAFDGEKMKPEEFLSIVRNPPGRNSWAILEGTATHRRDGARTIKAPIRLGILFTPERTIAQIDFNHGEIYNIGQTLGRNANTVMSRGFPASRREEICLYGIEPQDLTMSFLYWKFEREETPESIRGQSCRVFLLKQPDGGKTVLKAHISSKYFFPVRVQWFALSGDRMGKEPFKTLEVSSFTQKDKFWYPGKLRIEGKNWKSMIAFDSLDADDTAKRIPANIFTETKEKK